MIYVYVFELKNMYFLCWMSAVKLLEMRTFWPWWVAADRTAGWQWFPGPGLAPVKFIISESHIIQYTHLESCKNNYSSKIILQTYKDRFTHFFYFCPIEQWEIPCRFDFYFLSFSTVLGQIFWLVLTWMAVIQNARWRPGPVKNNKIILSAQTVKQNITFSVSWFPLRLIASKKLPMRNTLLGRKWHHHISSFYCQWH
jgi:hypothetical protein